MLIQRVQAGEGFVTKVTFIATTIPSPVGSFVAGLTVPANELLRNQSFGVLGTDEAVNVVTVEERRFRARSVFKMVHQTSGSGVRGLAERTLDRIVAPVGTRPQMLTRRRVSLNDT